MVNLLRSKFWWRRFWNVVKLKLSLLLPQKVSLRVAHTIITVEEPDETDDDYFSCMLEVKIKYCKVLKHVIGSTRMKENGREWRRQSGYVFAVMCLGSSGLLLFILPLFLSVFQRGSIRLNTFKISKNSKYRSIVVIYKHIMNIKIIRIDYIQARACILDLSH